MGPSGAELLSRGGERGRRRGGERGGEREEWVNDTAALGFVKREVHLGLGVSVYRLGTLGWARPKSTRPSVGVCVVSKAHS